MPGGVDPDSVLAVEDLAGAAAEGLRFAVELEVYGVEREEDGGVAELLNLGLWKFEREETAVVVGKVLGGGDELVARLPVGVAGIDGDDVGRDKFAECPGVIAIPAAPDGFASSEELLAVGGGDRGGVGLCVDGRRCSGGKTESEGDEDGACCVGCVWFVHRREDTTPASGGCG